MDIEKIKKNEIQHSDLPSDLIEHIKTFHEILKVDTTPLEMVIEDFKKDINPEKEIQIWEQISASYQKFCTSHPKSSNREKKQAYANALLNSTKVTLL